MLIASGLTSLVFARQSGSPSIGQGSSEACHSYRCPLRNELCLRTSRFIRTRESHTFLMSSAKNKKENKKQLTRRDAAKKNLVKPRAGVCYWIFRKRIFRIDANLFTCLLNLNYYLSYKFNLTSFVFGKCKLLGNRFRVFKNVF